MVWRHDDMGHSTLTIHVDTSGQGLGIWFVSEKVGYQCPLPIKVPSEAIFFFKALAVCCTIHLATQFPCVTCLLIITDNTNTFDIFTSLRALPAYNPILMSAIKSSLNTDWTSEYSISLVLRILLLMCYHDTRMISL